MKSVSVSDGRSLIDRREVVSVVMSSVSAECINIFSQPESHPADLSRQQVEQAFPPLNEMTLVPYKSAVVPLNPEKQFVDLIEKWRNLAVAFHRNEQAVCWPLYFSAAALASQASTCPKKNEFAQLFQEAESWRAELPTNALQPSDVVHWGHVRLNKQLETKREAKADLTKAVVQRENLRQRF